MRIARDDLDVRVLFFQVAGRSGDRPARSRRRYEVGNRAGSLLPNLGTRSPVMSLHVGRVKELIDHDGVWRLGGDAVSHVQVVIGIVAGDGCRRDDDLRAKRLHQPRFLLAELVGHGEDAAVAFDRSSHRERQPRIPCRPFDDHTARLEAALGFRRLDHRYTDAILQRTRRVHELCFPVHGRLRVADDFPQAHQRRPANELQDVLVRGRMRRRGWVRFH